MTARDPTARPGPLDPHTDIAGALHDVSNTLTVILGWAAEARAGSSSHEALLHALLVIEEQAQIAQQLARRAIGAETSLAQEETQLDAVLGTAIDVLAVEAHRANVRLTLAGRPGGARIRRSTDLHQIVTNLVLNALSHAPAGSEVRLEVAVGPATLTLDVQDHGPGIPEARRATVFEGDSTREGGAGIGLRHARALARAASGELELAAAEDGARFRLTWPRWGSVSMPPPSTSSDPVLSGRRVLIVEDDEHVALLLESALGARGATVSVARDAAEFEAALLSGPQDIALVDLSPIASDVNTALARLRKNSPSMVLVIISGSAAVLPEEAALGGVRWVRKPFEVAEIIAAVLAPRGS
jgi:CheY-like chemotaxis protein/two-component sensor histidine kinase